MKMTDNLLGLMAEAPDSQIESGITDRLRDLIGRKNRAREMKDILDDCAYASLASDFAMTTMDVAWKEMIKEERMRATRCKFQCNSVKISGAGENQSKDYDLTPVIDDSAENKEFFKWTPSGQLSLQIVNPNIVLEPGGEYYLDITPVGE